MKEVLDVVHSHLRDAETSWAVAVFGALAEYHSIPGDARQVRLDDVGGTIISPGGAFRVALSEVVRLAPYEFLTKRREYWLHGVNLCLPQDEAGMACHAGLTELGPDGDAIREQDRTAILFDLGLGRDTIQAMVRTDDPRLIDALRRWKGEDILQPSGMPAYRLLLDGQLHRVFRSRLGRVEVYNPIPPPDGQTAPGPHTHILPDLLKSDRTHSANVPVPKGYVPVLHLCPPNPILQRDGDAGPMLDKSRMDAFAELLFRFGEPELENAKQRARDGVAAGAAPPDPHGLTRRQRIAVRVALRKLAALHPSNAAVARWQSVFEIQPGPDE